jgi:hypothetical protein
MMVSPFVWRSGATWFSLMVKLMREDASRLFFDSLQDGLELL